MKSVRVLVPLARGFEEIEAVTVIDVLRRAGVEVVVAALQDGTVEASRQTQHLADIPLEAVFCDEFDAVILPGGQPGTDHLRADPRIRDGLLRHIKAGKWVAAICAAPLVLHEAGILVGKRVTSHPSVRHLLTGVQYVEERVVVDGQVVTSRAPGTAMEFALKLVELLVGVEKRREVQQGLLMKE